MPKKYILMNQKTFTSAKDQLYQVETYKISMQKFVNFVDDSEISLFILPLPLILD